MKRQIAIYGKGGIGKSTIAANLSAAFSGEGLSVFQIGCDPKHDSTSMLNDGRLLPTILDQTRKKEATVESIEEVIFKGYNGVVCAEAGGPEPGIGCAGRGVMVALQLLSDFDIYGRYGIDLAIYDVLGDVVCGGFAQPIRKGYAEEIYLVCSGELLALYSVNNLAKGIRTVADGREHVKVGGLINNMRGVLKEKEIIREFSEKIGVPIIGYIPRSEYVQKAELNGKTVVEAFPQSEQAGVYRDLARRILNNEKRVVPEPIELEDIIEIIKKYQVVE
ncbi:MAG: nitrogenase iron protein NifH [Halobacteriota archaeon]|nr:nitrogenase iron protein NifH [Halobacteriota archaeon]